MHVSNGRFSHSSSKLSLVHQHIILLPLCVLSLCMCLSLSLSLSQCICLSVFSLPLSSGSVRDSFIVLTRVSLHVARARSVSHTRGLRHHRRQCLGLSPKLMRPPPDPQHPVFESNSCKLWFRYGACAAESSVCASFDSWSFGSTNIPFCCK